MNDTITYIHYGHDRFIKEQFQPIQNDSFPIPKGRLWASPIDSEYGWIIHCIINDHEIKALTKYFKFTLSDNCEITTINSYSDLEKLPIIDSFDPVKFLDFKEIAKRFDVIYLTLKGERKTRISWPINLSGWDCECILVMNPDCIIPVD